MIRSLVDLCGSRVIVCLERASGGAADRHVPEPDLARSTWRDLHVRPGAVLQCVLAEDFGLSRSAGSFAFQHDSWWVKNDSRSSLLYLSGDLGFRVDLPPGMQVPLHQWHIKIRLQGVQGDYTLRLRLPDLDDVSGKPGEAVPTADGEQTQVPGMANVETSTHRPRP